MSELAFLPGLPAERIRRCYERAPGNEIASGKFSSPESSAALVANTFGLFLEKPWMLPPLPGAADPGWPAHSVELEAVLRFPWSGGRHPCLDVIIETQTALIGVESKRYEAYRLGSTRLSLSDAYRRDVWGARMRGCRGILDGLLDNASSGGARFDRLDAAQLVKHAFALRTAVHGPRKGSGSATGAKQRDVHGKLPVLYYLYAEPSTWPDGRKIAAADTEAHRVEVQQFEAAVAGDEVAFLACRYRDLLTAWKLDSNDVVRAHAAADEEQFGPL